MSCNSERSIYELVTGLCEKCIDSKKYTYEGKSTRPLIKHLRKNAFEFLLKKKTSGKNIIQNNVDPICHLLAWEYRLKLLNQLEKAEQVAKITKKIEESKILDNPVIHNLVIVLLNLQNTIPDDNKISKTSISDRIKSRSLKDITQYDQFTEDKFQLPDYLKQGHSKTYFDKSLFESQPVLNFRLVRILNTNLPTSYSTYEFTKLNAKKKYSLARIEANETLQNNEIIEQSADEILDQASRLPYNHHRTWESLGIYNPEKELPFATESSSSTTNNIEALIETSVLKNNSDIYFKPKFVPIEKFIESVKFMLVGIPSNEFMIDDKTQFYLQDNICIEGLSSGSLKMFCKELMSYGSCYIGLQKLCSFCLHNIDNNLGFVFKEMCKCINCYLLHYRLMALSIPPNQDLLSIGVYLNPIKRQIIMLSQFCKICEYEDKEKVPCGAQLLTFLDQKISTYIEKDLLLILYSIFYPCCQIYLRRFLQNWLFEGVILDPYEEFMIKIDTNYTNVRSRVYWTRCFSLRENEIPDFLYDLRNDILLCGKTMNLLRLCKPNGILSSYFTGESQPIISCCMTYDQFRKSKKDFANYYIDAATRCGPRVSLEKMLLERSQQDKLFLSIAEQKRALTFKRIELEKQKAAEEKAKQKRNMLEDLKEQMKIAAEQKKREKEDELRRDLLIAEQYAQMEEMKAQLVKEETNEIIKYYNSLIETVDKRKATIEKFTEDIKKTNILFKQIDITKTECAAMEKKIEELQEKKILTEDEKIHESTKTHNINSETKEIVPDLDVLNANFEKSTDFSNAENLNNQRNETNLAAQRNKAKIMNLEFGIYTNIEKSKVLLKTPDTLTDAQRNKLKVLSSEFDIIVNDSHKKNYNKNNNESSAESLKIEIQNLASPGEELVMNINHKRKLLALPDEIKTPELNSNNEANKLTLKVDDCPHPSFLNGPTPMSVDSTPMTEIATPSSSKMFMSTEHIIDSAGIIDSALTTNSNITEDGFKFPEPKKYIFEKKPELQFANKKIFNITENISNNQSYLELTEEDINDISNMNIKLLLKQSLTAPIEAQIKLVNSEIIKFFLIDEQFFSHLHSLRCYYFLLDGEFGRRITEGLFNKLYEVRNPIDMLNCRTLQLIMSKALFASSKIHENSEKLSFTIKNIPKSFNLNSIDVLDCLSMNYRISWPLNILLPSDAIEKYELVFKYLLKLHHVSWILQKMFEDLKLFQIGTKSNESILIKSPQYHKLQLFRHIMMHFIQTLQNYTISEVLQTSWVELEKNMKSVNKLDELYSVHAIYVKTIVFRCLLNKKCAPIMKVIYEIFVVILKFYNHLKMRSWTLNEENEQFEHPNFKKLNDIFNKFEEFTLFVFRLGNKMAKVGYQPHLEQMLDMLNMNAYYTSKLSA